MSYPLEQLSIASPCNADWNSMHGDEQVRFCQHCQLNVYNLSGMSRGEAEALIESKEGRLCVRFFQRSDGTVITRDCPVGLQALHRRKINRWGAVAAAITLITIAGAFSVSAEAKRESKAPIEQRQVQSQPISTKATMGDVAPPMMGAPSVHVNQENMGLVAPSVKPVTPPAKPCKRPKKKHQPMQGEPIILTPQQNPPAVMGKIAAPKPYVNQPVVTPNPPSTPETRQNRK